MMKDSLNYSQVHKNSVRAALRQLQVEARQHAIRGDVRPPDTDLTRVLSTKGFVDDMPQESVPRVLLQSSSAKGAVVSLGNLRGIVKEELGKGTYGKVVLLESNDDPTVIAVAVKAQAPTDCLALEYVILNALQERVEPHCKGHFPFPRALSFVSVGDGALLGMTNASTSGINLVDLVNVYKVLEDTPVPELIALHYTVLMLKIIETLHWHGKILVRSVCFVCLLLFPGRGRFTHDYMSYLFSHFSTAMPNLITGYCQRRIPPLTGVRKRFQDLD